MSWVELCRQLRKRAIRLGRLDGGRWYIEPRSRLGPDLEAAIAEHHDQLIGILADPIVIGVMKSLGGQVVAINPRRN